jgi:hypothetical protein
MVTLINKQNPLVTITVPEVSVCFLYIIISKRYISQQYHKNDNMYLFINEWEIKGEIKEKVF